MSRIIVALGVLASISSAAYLRSPGDFRPVPQSTSSQDKDKERERERELSPPTEAAWEFLRREDVDKQTRRCRKMPMMLYLGFGHSGSTSLSWQLNMNPQISYGNVKEHGDFMWPHHGGPLRATDIEKYASEFSETPCNKSFVFDASIRNAFQPQYDRNRYKEALGQDLKFLFMFRDPADWLRSLFHIKGAAEVRSRLRKRHDCYVDWIQNWLNEFPRENFLFINSVDYFKDPQAIINKITDFMGAQRYAYTQDQLHPINQDRGDYTIPAHFPEIDHYWKDPGHQDCAKRLNALLNMSIPWG